MLCRKYYRRYEGMDHKLWKVKTTTWNGHHLCDIVIRFKHAKYKCPTINTPEDTIQFKVFMTDVLTEKWLTCIMSLFVTKPWKQVQNLLSGLIHRDITQVPTIYHIYSELVLILFPPGTLTYCCINIISEFLHTEGKELGVGLWPPGHTPGIQDRPLPNCISW